MKTKNDAAPQSSPLPWRVEGECLPIGKGHCRGGQGASIVDANGRDVVIGGSDDEQGGIVGVEKESDAALIVRRVNQGPVFEAMVKNLEKIETHESEFFEDGVSADLAEEGIDTVTEAFKAGYDEAAREYKEMVSAALKLAQESKS